MLKEDVIAYFGSSAAAARALRIQTSAVTRWPDVLPEEVAFKVELVTNGFFKTDETLRLEAEAKARMEMLLGIE